MVRKRYTVAVVGKGGMSAAQRNEVSRHRRERDALAVAGDERDRLSITYGAAARHYSITVECDGAVLHTLAPRATSGDDAEVVVSRGASAMVEDDPIAMVDDRMDAVDDMDVALHAEPTGRDDDTAQASVSVPVDAPTSTDGSDLTDMPHDVSEDPSTPPPSTDQEPEMSDTASVALPGAVFTGSRRDTTSRHEVAPRRASMPSWDDVPSGPVPAEVLRYFESAVAREEARNLRRRREEHAA